jgi:hypothetical protein
LTDFYVDNSEVESLHSLLMQKMQKTS